MQAFLDSLAPEAAAAFGHLVTTRPEEMRRVFQAVVLDIQTVDTILSDIPPADEPVTDYVTEIDVRCELFTKFRIMVQNPYAEYDIANATVLAMFMVAPVHQLRSFLEGCEINLPLGLDLQLAVSMAAPFAVRACTDNRPPPHPGLTDISFQSSQKVDLTMAHPTLRL